MNKKLQMQTNGETVFKWQKNDKFSFRLNSNQQTKC